MNPQQLRKRIDESLRLTFEDTLRRQTLLRQKLEQLIKERRPLKESEKEEYFETLYKALLTVGRGRIIYYRLSNQSLIPLGTLMYFAEKMAYQRKPYVLLRYNGVVYKIPIEEMWRTLLDYCLMYFPHALWEALHMSPERMRWQKPGALEYKPSLRYGGAQALPKR